MARAARLLRWAALLACAPTSVSAAPPSSLQAKLAAIAHSSSFSVGIFVERLERQETAAVNAERPFPLASTFKLPLALIVLRAVERHELPPLDSAIPIAESDLLPGVSLLYERMPRGGRATLREVLAMLLENGDNSAANVLMRLAGGGPKVQAALAALGLATDISIDRDETEQNLAQLGLEPAARSERSPARLLARMNSVPADRHRATLAAFLGDPRDHGSARAMAKIVAAIWQAHLLSAPNLAFLQGELARNRRGPHRIRAGVPAGVAVADRTGTCDGLGDGEAACVNDVGVMTLPSGEHIVLAVYVLDGSGPVADKERLIAEVARVVWEDGVARDGERRATKP